MKTSFFYGYIIIFIVFILQTVMFGPQASFGVFIKPLSTEFDWSRTLIAGAFSMSNLVQGLSTLITGWLNDRLGPRIILTICGVLVGAGLMLMYLVDSAWQLYLFYAVLIGIGMGGVSAPQMSTIARWFVKRRNIATSVLFVGGGFGGFVGPPLITWLIYTHSWREAFLFVGIGAFIIIILAAQFLRRDPSQMGQVPYGKGSETKGWEAPINVSGLSIKQALNTRKFWLFAITGFCVGFCLNAPMVHIVPYAIDRGISPVNAALILSSMNVALPVGSVSVGLIADRIGSRRAFFTCVCLLSAITLLSLPVTNPWLLGAFVTLLSLGAGGVVVLISSLIAELFGMKSHGTILGFLLFTCTLGNASGIVIAGYIFDATGSYLWVFLLCGIIVAVAIIMAFLLNRIRKMEASA